MESELINRISSEQNTIGGTLRIAGYSSVMRSVIMPCLDTMIATHPGVNIELFVREIRDLPRILANNEADMIVTPTEPAKQEIVSHGIGHEENVLVESKQKHDRSDIYLDHDRDDHTTELFFKTNTPSSKNIRRNYLDEIYTIIDGVKRGWGRAAIPMHLIAGDPYMRVIKGYKSYTTPVMLQYYAQPYYSRLQDAAVQEIRLRAPKILAGKSGS